MNRQQHEGDQVAYRRSDEVDRLGELTNTEIDQGELEAGVNDDLPQEPDAENLELLTELEMRAGETNDPTVATEEGMTYVPPTDPPVIPDHDDPQGAQVAAGFGATALAEPFDADHHSQAVSDDDEMATRVREALRADATTSTFAEAVAIGTRGSTVALRGVVDDILDTDNAIAVVKRVTGVDEVLDELEVRSITG